MRNSRRAGCVRLHLNNCAAVRMTADDQQLVAREGETVLTALQASLAYVHNCEFYSERRAGFCLMGACQDCCLWRIFGSGLGDADRDRLRVRPKADVTMDAARAAIKMVPELANVLLVRSWSGIEGLMSDGLPVGAVLAELWLDGSSPTSPKGPSISRFAQRSAIADADRPANHS
jgi:hypothetical protein